MGKLPSAEERARRVCHWPGHPIGLPDKRCKECKAVVGEILADRNAVLEAAAKVVKRREVENGTAAEGAEEPWFSIHTHTEVQLHNAVGDIRRLKEDEE